MSGYGYPHNPSGYGYGGAPPPPQPYASQPPPYGQPPSPQHPYGQSPTAPPYGAPHYGGAEGGKPPKENKPSYGGAYYGGAEGGAKPPKESNPSYYGGAYYGGAEGGAKPPKENNPSYYGGAYYGGAEGGAKPPKENNPSYYGGNYYGAAEGAAKPPKENNPSYYGGASHGYGPPPAAYPSSGSPFAAVLPSTFPPGTDPSIIACFQVADQDGSGLIDDKELQRALSSYNQSFSLRTVHLLMYLFTDSNSRKIGPKEFVSLYYSLQSWREIFERFDRDRSGKIDTSELRDALYSLGFSVSPVVLDLLVSKFDKTGGHNKAIEYDNFIECCLTVKGLTEKFKARDKALAGTATFTYEDFMLAVLPFLIA